MARVVPRSRSVQRPCYVPTAIAERLSRPILPSDALSEREKRTLKNHGYDPDWLDTLTPDIVRVHMRLPLTPVPPTELKIYRPDTKPTPTEQK